MRHEIDVILSWPRNCDYPIWRKFMQLHRPRFNNVFVVLTETNQGEDYSEFLMQALADLNVQVLDTRTKQMNSSDDWRNISTNEALRLCTSEWVWFTEQDFVMGMPNEWMKLSEFLSEYDVVGFADGDTRLHPACLFAKREVIEKTQKNFGIVPDKSDHFSIFYADLLTQSIDIGIIPELTNYHMNGLSHNMMLAWRGEQVTYKPDDFKEYLETSLKITELRLDERFTNLCTKYLQTFTTPLS